LLKVDLAVFEAEVVAVFEAEGVAVFEAEGQITSSLEQSTFEGSQQSCVGLFV
jgi:hypothetical protein